MVVAIPLVVLGALWLYLSVIATVAVAKAAPDSALRRVGQLLVAWVVPFVGALFVLRMQHEQSPGNVLRLLPWPFRAVVAGEERPPNPNADDVDRPNFWSGGFPPGR